MIELSKNFPYILVKKFSVTPTITCTQITMNWMPKKCNKTMFTDISFYCTYIKSNLTKNKQTSNNQKMKTKPPWQGSYTSIIQKK